MNAGNAGTVSGIKKVFVKCNLCGADDYVFVTSGREHEYDNTTDDWFNVVQCKKCSLIYLNPRPAVDQLSVIYPHNYYSYNQKVLRDAANPHSILQKLRYKGFQAKVLKSLALANHAEHGVKVLDIGCGDGHTLDLYAAQDRVETFGVDFNQEALAQAKANKHTVYAGRFEDVDLPTDFFDLITATHVIEHVEDPLEFAGKAFAILKPGGILWLETPNIDSLDARMFRSRHWGGYHFPRHWVFFSKSTLEKLAGKIGFEVEFVDFVPNAIFWFWTMHSILLENYPQWRDRVDVIFPPIDFQRDSLANFLRICFFCTLDVGIKLATKETSNMIVALRKPLT